MEKQVNLLTYQSIKTVKAAKITDIIAPKGFENAPHRGVYRLQTDHGEISVYGDYVVRHKPQVGGYYVQYADGYESYSPAPAFEQGYFLMGKTVGLSFSSALELIKRGKRVQRLNWNGAGQWVVMIYAGNAAYTKGGTYHKMQDCIGLKTAQGGMQPGWVPSIGDLLAEDWQQVEE